MGRPDEVLGLAQGVDDPVAFWVGVLDPDISVEYYDPVLLAAKDVLSEQEFANIQARLAEAVSRSDVSAAHHAWARRIAEEIAGQGQIVGDQAVWTYTLVLDVAEKYDAQTLAGSALDRIAATAIASRDISDLIQAGFQRHFRNAE